MILREGCRRVRFYCEWCHQRVKIVNGHAPYTEVLGHFTSCPRRAPVTTEEQVVGLASHITNIIAERGENRLRQVG